MKNDILNDYNCKIFDDGSKASIISRFAVVIIFAIFSFILIDSLFNNEVHAMSSYVVEFNKSEFTEIYSYYDEHIESLKNYIEQDDYCSGKYVIAISHMNSLSSQSLIGYCFKDTTDVYLVGFARANYSSGFKFRKIVNDSNVNFNEDDYRLYRYKLSDESITELSSGISNYDLFAFYYDAFPNIYKLDPNSTSFNIPAYTTFDLIYGKNKSQDAYAPILRMEGVDYGYGDVLFEASKNEITKTFEIDSSKYKNFTLSFIPKEGESINTLISSSFFPLSSRYEVEAFNVKTYCDNELINESENVLFSGLVFGSLSSICPGELKYELTLKKDIPNYNPSQVLKFDFISNYDSNVSIEYIEQDAKETIISGNVIDTDDYSMKITRTFNTLDYSNFNLFFHLRPAYSINKLTFSTLYPNVLPPLRLRYYCSSDRSNPYVYEMITTNYRYFYNGVPSGEIFQDVAETCGPSERYLEVSFETNLLNFREPVDITLTYERFNSDTDISDFYYSFDLVPQTISSESEITDARYQTDIESFTSYLDQFLKDFDGVKDLVNDVYNRFFDSLPFYIQLTIDLGLILLLCIVIIKVGVST